MAKVVNLVFDNLNNLALSLTVNFIYKINLQLDQSFLRRCLKMLTDDDDRQRVNVYYKRTYEPST